MNVRMCTLAVELLANMPALRELQVLDFIHPPPLAKAINSKVLLLPTVEKLTMKPNQKDARAHPLLIRACPNLKALTLDMNSDSTGITCTVDGSNSLRRVWGAAGELRKLEELCVAKYGYQVGYGIIFGEYDKQSSGWELVREFHNKDFVRSFMGR
ncbi:hypothetical protein MFIFM68171_04711 [Madurella fahalii]|uniref:F-box/LRR-repeat protein n=1 Tax=Madurella fahalii TaxID=1157608 RepID=A0ABQ0G9V7_9PEZI